MNASLTVEGCYLADLLMGSPASGQGYYELGTGKLRYFMSGRDECWIDLKTGRIEWSAAATPTNTQLWFYELGTGKAAFSVVVSPGAAPYVCGV